MNIRLNTNEDVKNFIKTTLQFVSPIKIRDETLIWKNAKSILAIYSLDLKGELQVNIETNNKLELDKFNKEMKKYEIMQ